MNHSFNCDIAKLVGVQAATFLEHIRFWVLTNLNEGRNIKDGNCWTYNSVKALSKTFLYWSPRQIETVIQKCIDSGLLVKGVYNKHNYDRTSWYALTPKAWEFFPELDKNLLTKGVPPISQKCEMDSTEMLNAFHKNVEPIPDSYPDTKTQITTTANPVDNFQDAGDSSDSKTAVSSAFIVGEEEDRELIKFNLGYPMHAKDNREFLFWCKYCLDHRIKAQTRDDKMKVLKSWIRGQGLKKPHGYGEAKPGVQTSPSGRPYAPAHAHQSAAYDDARELLENRAKNEIRGNPEVAKKALDVIREKMKPAMEKIMVN